MMRPLPNATDPRSGPSGDPEKVETPVTAFFDRHANYYECSWDRREHGLHVGIFESLEDAEGSGDDALEFGYQRSRDHVIDFLRTMRPMGSDSRIPDVCCRTAATPSQITHSHDYVGVGVDISRVQIEHTPRPWSQHSNMKRTGVSRCSARKSFSSFDMRTIYEQLIMRTNATAEADAMYAFLEGGYGGIMKAMGGDTFSWAWLAVRKS
jgi:hypothetical protein